VPKNKKTRIALSPAENECLKNIFYIYRDKNQEETDDLENLFSGENLVYIPELLHDIIVEAISDYKLEDDCKRLMTFLKIRLEVKGK